MGKTFKKILCTFLVVVMCLTAAPLDGFVGIELHGIDIAKLFGSKASAADYTEGYYTYRVSYGVAAIIDVDESIGGDIIIPSTLGGYTVEQIRQSAFDSCDNLTSVTIPYSITSISGGAFSRCGLKSINVDKNNNFYSSDSEGILFNKNKTTLIQYPIGKVNVSYTIPSSVTGIGSSAFYNCDNLMSITLSDSVTRIGSTAFINCDNLYSITLTNSVISIGESAFANCPSLTSITIPDSVTTIANYAFSRCTSLTSVTIGNSVTTIGYCAFEFCDNLPSITIPDSVTTIESSTFLCCESLTSITIPDSVTTIGNEVFLGCNNLTSINVTKNNIAFSSDSIGVLFNKNKTILIQYPIGNINTSYIIPNSVTTISDYAFYDSDNLTNVTISDSVTGIGSSAFSECNNLTSVATGESVATIGRMAFENCPRLTSITIPNSVTSIGIYAFTNCSSLTSITIPDGVITITTGVFSWCKSLTSVTIPDSVTTIGDEAFRGCKNLTNITIPDRVTTIGYDAFCDCDSITNIMFLDSVTTIEGNAFSCCDNLKNVTIGTGITTIREFVFETCTSLTSITIPDSVETICYYAFYNCNSLTDVYYKGTEEQWNGINIEKNNEPLTNATIHFLGEEEPELDGYKLRLRSDGAYSDSIAVGKEISLWTFLWNNDTLLDCERAYAISFDNPGVFEVVKTEITEPSFDVTLKAIGEGTTNMTISDSETGAYVTIKLKANKPVDVLTMDDVKKLATEEYGGITTYFYNINGLYINNYSYSENKNGTYNVKMTVYNEKAHYGAVVSYDKNGNIHKFEVINPKDKLPENLWDGLYDSFDYVNYKLADWFGDTNYTDIGWTQRTPITIEVPEGGYFEITNKYFNEIVFMTNVIDLTIDLAFAVNDLPEIGIKGATVETVKQLFIKIGSKGIEKLCKKIFKEYSKGIGFENIYDIIFDVAELTKEYDVDFFEIITENINYEELIMDSVESVVLSVIAKPVKEVLDGFGYINTLIKCGDFFNSSLASEVAVYTPAEEPYERVSSGVKVTSETQLDPDYVLHSYIINEADNVMAGAKPTIEALGSNYQMYDITLYKSSQAVQPNAKIKVMIPIPAGYNKNNIQVYWYKEDGTLESMNAIVNGSHAVFETDHLSYYVLVEEQVHSHADNDHNGICDGCDYDFTKECSCRCHNDNFFAKLIWKIINFFNKLLRRNQECNCGLAHY